MTQALPLLPFALLLIVLPLPGTVALRLLCLAVAAVIAAMAWWRRAGERPVVPCKPALLAWIGVSALSLFYSAVPEYSLDEFKNEIGYSMLAFLSFLVVARDRETTERLLLALAAGFGCIGLWALATWTTNDFSWNQAARHGGTGVFSTYIVTAVPALFWLAAAGSRPGRRALGRALLALAFVLAFLTQQRAIWPTLAAEFAVLGAWLFRRGLFGRRAVLWAVLVAAAMAAAFYAVSVSRSEGREVQVDLAQDTRLPAWNGMLEKIAEHPVAGAGFGRMTMAYAYPELVPRNNPLLAHPHNVFLTYAIGMGLPGMLVIAALFLSFGRQYGRLQGLADERVALLGLCGIMLIVGVVVRNQFNDFFVRDMALLYWALTGIFLGEASRTAGKEYT